MNIPAPILSCAQFADLQLTKTIVCTSGGYDPIHPGHVSCLLESKSYGDILVVVVNGDKFLLSKKGYVFQDLLFRCQVIAAIQGVDYVIPFESEDDDMTINQALAIIRPHVFTKGGDRQDETSIPEWETCRQFGIRVVTNVGIAKRWSSSEILSRFRSKS